MSKYLEPNWNGSRTPPTELWKNPILSMPDRLQIADGAIASLRADVERLDRLASQTAALNERAGMRAYELEQALAPFAAYGRAARVGTVNTHRDRLIIGIASSEGKAEIRDSDVLRAMRVLDAALSQQPNQNSERP